MRANSRSARRGVASERCDAQVAAGGWPVGVGDAAVRLDHLVQGQRRQRRQGQQRGGKQARELGSHGGDGSAAGTLGVQSRPTCAPSSGQALVTEQGVDLRFTTAEGAKAVQGRSAAAHLQDVAAEPLAGGRVEDPGFLERTVDIGR